MHFDAETSTFSHLNNDAFLCFWFIDCVYKTAPNLFVNSAAQYIHVNDVMHVYTIFNILVLRLNQDAEVQTWAHSTVAKIVQDQAITPPPIAFVFFCFWERLPSSRRLCTYRY